MKILSYFSTRPVFPSAGFFSSGNDSGPQYPGLQNDPFYSNAVLFQDLIIIFIQPTGWEEKSGKKAYLHPKSLGSEMVTHHFHAHTVDNNLCSYTELKQQTLVICREEKERVCGKLNSLPKTINWPWKDPIISSINFLKFCETDKQYQYSHLWKIFSTLLILTPLLNHHVH